MIHEYTPPPPRPKIFFVFAQDSRRGVEFPLAVRLALQSCAVKYLNQTWLEALDYLMNGVLGDGPWCPWLLDTEVRAHGGFGLFFLVIPCSRSL